MVKDLHVTKYFRQINNRAEIHANFLLIYNKSCFNSRYWNRKITKVHDKVSFHYKDRERKRK